VLLVGAFLFRPLYRWVFGCAEVAGKEVAKEAEQDEDQDEDEDEDEEAAESLHLLIAAPDSFSHPHTHSAAAKVKQFCPRPGTTCLACTGRNNLATFLRDSFFKKSLMP